MVSSFSVMICVARSFSRDIRTVERPEVNPEYRDTQTIPTTAMPMDASRSENPPNRLRPVNCFPICTLMIKCICRDSEALEITRCPEVAGSLRDSARLEQQPCHASLFLTRLLLHPSP